MYREKTLPLASGDYSSGGKANTFLRKDNQEYLWGRKFQMINCAWGEEACVPAPVLPPACRVTVSGPHRAPDFHFSVGADGGGAPWVERESPLLPLMCSCKPSIWEGGFTPVYQFLKPVSMSLSALGNPEANQFICTSWIDTSVLYTCVYLTTLFIYKYIIYRSRCVYIYIYMYIFYDIMGIGNFYVFAIDTCDVKQI